MSDEDFRKARPEHMNQIQPDQPHKTGVSWIDEMEAQLFTTKGGE